VAVGQQPDQQPVHQLLLADDNLADLRAEPADPASRGLDLLIQWCAHNPANLGTDARILKLSAKIRVMEQRQFMKVLGMRSIG